MAIRRVGARPRNLENELPPLVPVNICSAHQQRIVASAVFCGILAFKGYNYIHCNETAPLLGILTKWCILDASFFLGLYIFRIPWLQKRLWFWILFFIVSLIVNATILQPRWIYDVGLTKYILDLLNSFYMIIRKQYIRLKGEKVRAVIVRYNSSHIVGKHSVRLLPYATAKLNPDDDKLCLQRSSIRKKPAIKLPILFNKTSPNSIRYSRLDFETGNRTMHDVYSKEIEQHRMTDVVHDGVHLEYVDIPVNQPGVYQLEEALDKDGMGIKIYKRDVTIVYCPMAKFILKSGPNLCVEDDIHVDLILQGVPPLNVIYERRINNYVHNMTIDSIGPEHYISPPIRSDQEAMTLASSGNYQWAHDQITEVRLNLSAEFVADYWLKVLQLQDVLNNTISYKNDQNPNVNVRFSVYTRPTASFMSDISIYVRPKQTAKIPLDLQGQEPWNVKIGYWSEDVTENDDATIIKPSEEFDITINNPETENLIKVQKPGMYRILSVSDSKCAGQVLAPSFKNVILAYPPTVKFDVIPIPADDCPGEVGVEVILSLTGTPPWQVEYSVISQNKEKKEYIKIEKSRHSMIIKPTTSGQYEYRFFRLMDFIYREGVKIDHKFSQTVHPKPNAAFRGLKNRMLNGCVGSRIDLEVELVGTGPFTLIYEVVFNRRINAFTIADIRGSTHVLTSPPFDNPGLYTVTLVKITDSKGCSQVLNSSDYVTINVKKDRPTAGFRHTHEIITFLEGHDVKLPLQLTGHAPWNISYRYHGDVEKVERKSEIADPNSFLTVSEQGVYELLEVKDSFCYGRIIPEMKEVEARWLPRPSLRIAEDDAEPLPQKGHYHRRNVCEGSDDSVGLVMEGRAPWEIYYRIITSDEELTRHQTVGYTTTKIRLMTNKAGRHLYNFTSIADDVYIEPSPILLTLEQTVNAKPVARFLSADTMFHCVDVPFTNKDIKIQLDGVPPFSLTFEVAQESSNKMETLKIEEIYESVYNFHPSTRFAKIGNYTITLVHIVDSHGCSNTLQGPNNKISIQVTDVASIDRTFLQQIHCVGDLLIYKLQGMIPYNITREYNGEVLHTISKTHTYTFGADKPGNMTITKVCHQGNQCCGYVSNLTEIIYDLPTAIVSEGKDIISDIREGDKTEIIVNFIGTPPFEFTYTRSELLINEKKERKPGRVLETLTVLNIHQYQHSIFTSQQGVFQVTRVKDRYCEYPPSSGRR
ncbi:21903_t:CDS:10 [Dentiscutata erythropus]|uniref:21903_t:CDS:1 n=1 Tax=Dentiscutata erythropus TaxID=1348616 RepID=A0A9N8VBZ9_9GLOM|nr:21903_t:CDS:10 [Dentiscutata erythropus]